MPEGKIRMPMFSFRLEPVLQVRKMREQEVHQELARLEQTRQAAEQDMVSTVAQLNKDICTPSVASMDMFFSLHREHYRECLRERVATQETALQEHGLAVEVKRDQLVRVMQDRLVLEKLKEKQAESFKSRESAREIRQMDELGTTTFCYRRIMKGGE